MALIRSIPNSRSISPLQSDFNRLFGSLFDTTTSLGGPLGRGGRFVPALDVAEREDAFVVSIDLPGLSEKDVKVEILEGVLTISGERTATSEETRDGYRHLERSSGSFSRSLTFPKGVDPATVAASFADGVLEVTVPKPEASKPQQVQIAVKAAA